MGATAAQIAVGVGVVDFFPIYVALGGRQREQERRDGQTGVCSPLCIKRANRALAQPRVEAQRPRLVEPPLYGHSSAVWLALPLDASSVATCSSDGTVLLWRDSVQEATRRAHVAACALQANKPESTSLHDSLASLPSSSVADSSSFSHISRQNSQHQQQPSPLTRTKSASDMAAETALGQESHASQLYGRLDIWQQRKSGAEDEEVGPAKTTDASDDVDRDNDDDDDDDDDNVNGGKDADESTTAVASSSSTAASPPAARVTGSTPIPYPLKPETLMTFDASRVSKHRSDTSSSPGSVPSASSATALSAGGSLASPTEARMARRLRSSTASSGSGSFSNVSDSPASSATNKHASVPDYLLTHAQSLRRDGYEPDEIAEVLASQGHSAAMVAGVLRLLH